MIYFYSAPLEFMNRAIENEMRLVQRDTWLPPFLKKKYSTRYRLCTWRMTSSFLPGPRSSKYKGKYVRVRLRLHVCAFVRM